MTEKKVIKQIAKTKTENPDCFIVWLNDRDCDDFRNLLNEYQNRPQSSPCHTCSLIKEYNALEICFWTSIIANFALSVIIILYAAGN